MRLMYECNPFAFIVEVAAGEATGGHRRILDFKPCYDAPLNGFFAGSNAVMAVLEDCVKKRLRLLDG